MLNPSTPLGYAELLLRRRIDRVRSRTVDQPSDLGASVLEWVIISAIVLAIALTVGGILTRIIEAKANGITLDTTNLPGGTGGGTGGGAP